LDTGTLPPRGKDGGFRDQVPDREKKIGQKDIVVLIGATSAKVLAG